MHLQQHPQTYNATLCYTSVVQRRVTHLWQIVILYAEKVLAGIVILGVAAYALGSAKALLGMDWTQSETFYQFIYRVLLLIIGLELARMLVTHSIAAVLELLSFVIARKMLKPDLTSVDIILSVFAFVALAIVGHFFLRPDSQAVPDARTT